MTSRKIIQLLNDLKGATEEERIRWGETADEDAFRIVLAAGMIRVGYREKIEEFVDGLTDGYLVTIMNREGKIFDEATITQANRDEYRIIQELYALARRSARGGIDLVDQMLAEVERK